jgi:glycerate dehydrogenase
MREKIVILDAHTSNPGDLSWQGFDHLGELTVYDHSTRAECVQRSQHATCLITNKVFLDAEILEQLPRLKYVGILASGYNNVDTVYAQKAGIVVCNEPSNSGSSVAQHSMAMILDHANQIAHHSSSVRAGDWSQSRDFCYTLTPLVELETKVLGILGYGAIGSRLAQMALAFGMQVRIYKRQKPASLPKGIQYCEIDQLFEESDYLSLNCPLNEQTLQIVNAQRLQQMRPSSVLLNTGRGALIDETALNTALVERSIDAAYLDVLCHEPPSNKHPLVNNPHCKISPHIAWATLAARKRLICASVENLKCFLAGSPINNVAN